jgi:hypothetical protein
MENINSNPSLASLTLWSWLFPVTYLLHIAEEYWGGEGYPAYILRLRGVHLSPTRFLVLQSIGFVLLVLGLFLARRLGFQHTMLVILGATVLVNGLTHTLTSISIGGYGPGLLSSIFIWMPLGIATLIWTRDRMSQRRYWLAIAIGFGINGIIAVMTLRGGRIA